MVTVNGVAATRPRLRLAGALLALLAGCGGGGGGSGGGSVPPEPVQANVAGLRCSGGGSSGWCWQAPQPSGHWVNDVAFTSARDGFAVGDGGRVLRTRDGGLTWDERVLPDAPLLQALRFAPDGRRGWLLGADGGRFWRTTDGGDSWVPAAAVPLDVAASLELADNGALVVRGDLGARSFASQVRVSDDGGNHWRDPGPQLLTIDADGTQWHWLDVAETGVRDIRLSTDGGKTFQRPAAWPAGRQAWTWESHPGGYAWVNFYTVGEGTDLALHLRPGSGQPWAPPALPTNGFGPLWFGADGRWASAGQSLWHADATGGAWAAVTPPYADYNSSGYGFVDGRTAWTREQWPSQAAWISTDGGAGWVRSLPFDDSVTFPVQLLRDGGGGLLLTGNGRQGADYDKPMAWRRSTDQGRSWTALPGERDAGLGAIAALWMLDARRGLALTPQGLLLQTGDGGQRWQASAVRLPPGEPSPSTVTMQFTPDGTGWVFNNGALYRSDDGGRNWAPLALNLPDHLPDALHLVDDRTAVVRAHQICYLGHSSYACQHRVFISTDRAATWRATDPPWPAGGPLTSLDSRRLVVAGVATSADGGQTWLPSRQPADLDLGDPVRVVRGAGALWLLAHHGLLRSADDGATWSAVTLPLPSGYVAAWPFVSLGLQDLAFADARQGWIVGGDGLVMATSDGGLSWQRQASGTRTDLTSVFALGPQAVWIGGARAAVLASASGGR
ncbi:MAG: YCF48-related protein [Rubrivivax sp.]